MQWWGVVRVTAGLLGGLVRSVAGVPARTARPNYGGRTFATIRPGLITVSHLSEQ